VIAKPSGPRKLSSRDSYSALAHDSSPRLMQVAQASVSNITTGPCRRRHVWPVGGATRVRRRPRALRFGLTLHHGPMPDDPRIDTCVVGADQNFDGGRPPRPAVMTGVRGGDPPNAAAAIGIERLSHGVRRQPPGRCGGEKTSSPASPPCTASCASIIDANGSGRARLASVLHQLSAAKDGKTGLRRQPHDPTSRLDR
jgi:hypothetical protein